MFAWLRNPRLLGIRRELETIHDRLDAVEDALDARRTRERRIRAREHLAQGRDLQAEAQAVLDLEPAPEVEAAPVAPPAPRITEREATRRALRRKAFGIQ